MTMGLDLSVPTVRLLQHLNTAFPSGIPDALEVGAFVGTWVVKQNFRDSSCPFMLLSECIEVAQAWYDSRKAVMS